MLSNLVWIMNIVREKLFEGFIIPDLNISYWDFCISLLVIGLVVKVLVNGVPNSHRSKNAKKQKDKGEQNSNDNNEN